MGATLILAKTTSEGWEYARTVGLPKGSYRLVRNASAIKGVRHAEVHLLPSFLARWDRHTIIAALRWARTLEVYYVDPADFAAPVDEDFVEVRPSNADILADPFAWPESIDFTSFFKDVQEPMPSFADTSGGAIREIAALLEPGDLSEVSIQAMESRAEPTSNALETPAEPPKRRRRSRCKECGCLHLKEEPCEDTSLGEPLPVTDDAILGVIGAQ